jgi:glycosyltransferase involved in cell wall biosynthesis
MIVVDGGSTDHTERIARIAGADVVVEHRRGYGRAYKRGFERAKGDIIVTSDGDATYPVESIAELVDYLLDTPLDFVSASRFPLRDKTSMSFRNFVGNVVMTVLVMALFHEKITDAGSGMWAFRKECLVGMHLDSDHWEMSEEIKIEAIRSRRIRFGEYPIPYKERVGETKVFPWRVGAAIVCFLIYKRAATVRSDLANRKTASSAL